MRTKQALLIPLLVSCLCLDATVAWGQKDSTPIILKVEVKDIPKSEFDGESAWPEGAFILIKYKVLKVIRGSFDRGEISVAHGIGSRRALNVGEHLVIEVKRTTEFREVAEFLKIAGDETFDRSPPDFVFVRFVSRPRSK